MSMLPQQQRWWVLEDGLRGCKPGPSSFRATLRGSGMEMARAGWSPAVGTAGVGWGRVAVRFSGAFWF